MLYYDMVVATARMMGKPSISFKELHKNLLKVTEALGQKIDETQLKQAWREFKHVPIPRMTYA